jgi:hypothetical protein
VAKAKITRTAVVEGAERVCPTAEAWARSEVNLAREFRRLRRSVKVCALCEAVRGPCDRAGVVTAREGIARALAEVLNELNRAV